MDIVGMGSRFYVTPESAINVSEALYCAFNAGEAHWVRWIIQNELPYKENDVIEYLIKREKSNETL